MIGKVLHIIKEDLNATMQAKGLVPEGTEIAGFPDLSRTGGGSDPILRGELLNMFLVNMEENRTHRPPEMWQVVDANGTRRSTYPPVKLDVFFLVASKFKDYTTALDHLTAAVRYFIAHRYFDRIAHPDLPEDIDRLIVEMIPMTFEVQRAVWSSLQISYLPSALFRMGIMITPESSESQAMPLVQEVVASSGRMP